MVRPRRRASAALIAARVAGHRARIATPIGGTIRCAGPGHPRIAQRQMIQLAVSGDSAPSQLANRVNDEQLGCGAAPARWRPANRATMSFGLLDDTGARRDAFRLLCADSSDSRRYASVSPGAALDIVDSTMPWPSSVFWRRPSMRARRPL